MATTQPPHVYLKHRCREIQGGHTHAHIYRSEQRWKRHDIRLENVKRFENQANSRLKKLRAKHLRKCYNRDTGYIRTHEARDRAEAKLIPLPVKAVQTLQYLASEDVIDTCNNLSLLPPELATLVSCFVIS